MFYTYILYLIMKKFRFPNLFIFSVSVLWIVSSDALVLETLMQKGILEKTFKNKKIGYYTGSFDPLHKGHEELAKLSVAQGFVDYCIIYPAFGGDDQFKKRVEVSLRLDMLYSVFATHPFVVVTRMTPKEMQMALTVQNGKKIKDRNTVKPAFEGTQFIGIIGSDTCNLLLRHEHEQEINYFMGGIKIPEKYKATTIGTDMALPVNDFIVGQREGDHLIFLPKMIGNRHIIAIINNNQHRSRSSTAVKMAIKTGNPITLMLSKSVVDIIEKHGLYTQSKADSVD